MHSLSGREPRRCYFLSDLHLFSRRARTEQLDQQIRAAAARAHTVVLGGDIFDFKWTTLPSFHESIRQSIDWLRRLVEQHPHCEFHYLLGNHDCHPEFVEALDELSFEQQNLSWQRYLLRLGHCLFLHGDILDGDLDHDELDRRRSRRDEVPPPGRMSHLLYDVVVKTRLHRAAILVRRRKTVLKRLRQYLEQLGQGPDSGVRHVYFGHTHRNLDRVEYGGLMFHNGGASIHGLSFRILEVPLEPPGQDLRNQRPQAATDAKPDPQQ